MADINKTLYQLLSNPDQKTILRPDLFVNQHTFENGHLVFSTSGYYTKSFTHSFRLYIPFTQSDELIPEYNNGIYDVYPLYNILIINAPSMNTLAQYSIVGAYRMNTTQFDLVYLDEDFNEIPVSRASDMVAIKRYQPKSMEPTAAMKRFFNELVNGETKLKFV